MSNYKRDLVSVPLITVDINDKKTGHSENTVIVVWPGGGIIWVEIENFETEIEGKEAYFDVGNMWYSPPACCESYRVFDNADLDIENYIADEVSEQVDKKYITTGLEDKTDLALEVIKQAKIDGLIGKHQEGR